MIHYAHLKKIRLRHAYLLMPETAACLEGIKPWAYVRIVDRDYSCKPELPRVKMLVVSRRQLVNRRQLVDGQRVKHLSLRDLYHYSVFSLDSETGRSLLDILPFH